jgi:hypothetical protein
MCALVLNALVTPLAETIATFHHLHPLLEVELHPLVDDFHPKTDVILDRETFISALTHSPHLSSLADLWQRMPF